MGQVYRPVQELIRPGVAERVEFSGLAVFDGLTGLLAVGAVVVDRVRGLGLGSLRRQREDGVLPVQGVVEALLALPIDHRDELAVGVAHIARLVTLEGDIGHPEGGVGQLPVHTLIAVHIRDATHL